MLVLPTPGSPSKRIPLLTVSALRIFFKFVCVVELVQLKDTLFLMLHIYGCIFNSGWFTLVDLFSENVEWYELMHLLFDLYEGLLFMILTFSFLITSPDILLLIILLILPFKYSK